MMLRNETWMVALEALWANKVRAFLTTLGVIIGSACIVLVVTVALSGRRYVIAQIEGVGSNLVYARLDIDPNRPAMLQDELSLEDMNAAKAAIPGVVTVAGTRGMQSSVIAGSVERSVNLVGVTEGFQQIRNLLILRGRFLDAEDVSARSRVCLITTQLANLMFPFADPVGQNLRVGELSFIVIGVFKERVETFGLSEIQDYSVLVPFPLMKYYLGDTSLEMLYVQAGTPDGVLAATHQLEALLQSRHPTMHGWAPNRETDTERTRWMKAFDSLRFTNLLSTIGDSMHVHCTTGISTVVKRRRDRKQILSFEQSDKLFQHLYYR